MNKIFEISENFDYQIINLENPTNINNNNHFCKITQGKFKKNIYIQLPKCCTKNGITQTKTRSYMELIYNSNEKNIINFFENLETYIVDKIYNSRDTWFYEIDNITKNDIEDFITPSIKTYKSGKNFLLKASIKLDKFFLYDENHNKIDLENLNNNVDIIPLILINGINLTNKNITIDYAVVQSMVMAPSDEFEKNILITSNNLVKYNNENKTLNENNNNNDENENKTLNENNNNNDENENKTLNENNNDENENNNDENENENKTLNENNNDENENENNNDENENNNNENENENDKTNNLGIGELIELSDLELEENLETINIKDENEIYLELYYAAKKRAKEIRKNAISAFLEAKNIKIKYNLNKLVDSDSSDSELE